MGGIVIGDEGMDVRVWQTGWWGRGELGFRTGFGSCIAGALGCVGGGADVAGLDGGGWVGG